MVILKGTADTIAIQPKMNVMSTPQVSISYSPFKEIIVMEKTFFNTPEDIARFTSVIAGGKLAGLYWVEGVVFLYFPLPASTTAVARELL